MIHCFLKSLLHNYFQYVYVPQYWRFIWKIILSFSLFYFSGTSDSFKFDLLGISIAERLLSRWCTGEIDLPFGFQLTVLIGMCHAENKERQEKLVTALKTNPFFLFMKKIMKLFFVVFMILFKIILKELNYLVDFQKEITF